MQAPMIQFDHVNKNFPQGKTQAVRDLSFDIFSGEFITVLGTSGSGKTTTLKMINRLIEADSGTIRFNGQDIKSQDVTDLRRQMGYVVQEVGLFPHLTVAGNIAVVPELLGWSKGQIKARVDQVLDLVHLPAADYRDRYPKELSGGQQQRVGVARALAANPKVMLLDEPFGAIDAITRSSMQSELKEIQQQFDDKTFVLVTHDIMEAFTLGDRVMIMDQGQLCQFDRPQAIIQAPATPFVAALMDTVKQQSRLWSELS